MSYVKSVVILLWGMILFIAIGSIYEIIKTAKKYKNAKGYEKENLKGTIIMYTFLLVLTIFCMIVALI